MSQLKRSLIVVLLVVLAVGLLPGLASAKIMIRASRANTWNPWRTVVGVHPGESATVRWKNASGRTHTVTAVGNKWEKNTALSNNQYTTHTFTDRGTYRFRCTIHAGMIGRVVVTKY